ncbi:MAG TPA: hypothetical protein VJ249_02055 [Candidatus Bathyarchaeia archaeon]|nr:hypothetical protein [Candidatus Bathyarchaeia archaeon]
MGEEKISTRHPSGKKGWSISKAKYDMVKASILDCLGKRELPHTDLTKCVGAALRGKLDGSVPWYTEVVKLDLEARRIIERNPETKPERYRIRRS